MSGAGEQGSGWLSHLPTRWRDGFLAIGAAMLISQGAAPFIGRGESRDILAAGLMILGLPYAVNLGQMLAGQRQPGTGSSRSPEPPPSSRDSS